MPNNFKLRGDYYVSKAGSDSNDGLTPDTPKRTVQAALNLAGSGTTRTIIVGSGVYNETLSKTPTNQIINLYSDGYTVLDFSLGKTFTHNTTTSTINFYSFEIKDCSSFVGVRVNFIDCKIVSLSFYPVNSTTIPYTALRCVFINCFLYTRVGGPTGTSFTSIGTSTINSCLFINTASYILLTSVLNTYIDRTSAVYGISSMTAANFNFNNLEGVIFMNAESSVTSGLVQDTYGRYYDLSLEGTGGSGTIQDPYRRSDTLGKGFFFSAHRTAYPSFNASSSVADPQFNNVLKQDFSLLSSSYNVGRASDYINNIGGTKVATRINASGSLFSGSGVTVDSLVFAPVSDYVISGSSVSGSVTSAAIFISSPAKVIDQIDYRGLLAFNKDITSPTGSDVNVPDVLTYTSASGQAGANPDRLTYYMRWTTGSSQPATDAQWENGGLWPAGSFNVFEWNTKPSVDYLGRGNGDQNYNIVNTPTFVKATWIQLRVTLRNDYLV